MFLYLVACTVITLLSAVTICSNILRYRELAELFYAIICVFSYVVWIYCFIVGEPTVIMQMHDILWQSQNYLLIVIVTIIVAVLYLIAYVCGLPGLKVFLFFAFVVCTHPIVMLIIHIFTIGGTVNDEESEVPLSNKDDYDYDYDYDYGYGCGDTEDVSSSSSEKGYKGDWSGSNGVTYERNYRGDLVGSNGVTFEKNYRGDWVGSNGVTYERNYRGDWVGSNGVTFEENYRGDLVGSNGVTYEQKLYR